MSINLGGTKTGSKVEISEVGLNDGLVVVAPAGQNYVIVDKQPYGPARPPRFSKDGTPIWVRVQLGA